jgi:hypothetical protein
VDTEAVAVAVAEVRTVLCKNTTRQNAVRCIFLPVRMYGGPNCKIITAKIAWISDIMLSKIRNQRFVFKSVKDEVQLLLDALCFVFSFTRFFSDRAVLFLYSL